MYLLKQKKWIIVILVVLFLVLLFLIKNTTFFKNQAQNGGLVYNEGDTVSDLVTKDTDGDTIPDWEEGLYGTDPLKRETTDGISDKTQIENKRRQAPVDGELNLNLEPNEKLTETDQLSREIFATVAALNQAGEVNDETVNTLSTTLAQKIQTSVQKKVFSVNDITIAKDDSVQSVRNYNDSLNKTFSENSPQYTVLDVLSKFIVDQNTVNEAALLELAPLVTQTNKIITQMTKIAVPPSMVQIHLEVLNNLEKLSENISDIRLYETDIVVAMSGISQYEKNTENLGLAAQKLADAINKIIK